MQIQLGFTTTINNNNNNNNKIKGKKKQQKKTGEWFVRSKKTCRTCKDNVILAPACKCTHTHAHIKIHGLYIIHCKKFHIKAFS